MLSRIDIFSSLSGDEEAALDKQCQFDRYSGGRQVVGQDDTTTDLFFIVEGETRIKRFSETGKEVSYSDLSAGQVFGEFSAVDGLPRSATVTTLSDCVIGRMTAQVFRQAMLDHPEIPIAALELVVSKARDLSDRIYEFSTLPVRQRIHSELVRMLEIGRPSGSSVIIDPAPTHQEIAARISTHREAVTRELRYLTTAGVIAAQRHRIVIKDPEKLRGLTSSLHYDYG